MEYPIGMSACGPYPALPSAVRDVAPALGSGVCQTTDLGGRSVAGSDSRYKDPEIAGCLEHPGSVRAGNPAQSGQ